LKGFISSHCSSNQLSSNSPQLSMSYLPHPTHTECKPSYLTRKTTTPLCLKDEINFLARLTSIQIVAN